MAGENLRESNELKNPIMDIKIDSKKDKLTDEEVNKVNDFVSKTGEEITEMFNSVKKTEDADRIIKILKLAPKDWANKERLAKVIGMLEKLQVEKSMKELSEIISKNWTDLLTSNLEKSPVLKNFLAGLTQEQWEDAYKNAKTRKDTHDLAALFRFKDWTYWKYETAFDRNKYISWTSEYEAALKDLDEDKQKEKEALYKSIRESLAPLYDDLARSSRVKHQNLSAERKSWDDEYWNAVEGSLRVDRDKRSDENLAVADLLVLARPSKAARDLYESASNKSAVMKALQAADTLNPDWESINTDLNSSYRYEGGDVRSNDLKIIQKIYSEHRDDINKLQQQEKMLKFVKKIKDWDTMVNVLEFVVRKVEDPEFDQDFKHKMKNWILQKDDIKKYPEIMKLYGKKRFLRSETSHVTKILNSASLENIKKIIELKKYNIDLKEVYNQTRLLESNAWIDKKEQISVEENPLLYLCDFSADWKLNRGREWVANSHRWSEQQMYSTFISVADTKETNWVKEIVNGRQTGDVIRGFKMLMKNKYGQELLNSELPDDKLDNVAIAADAEKGQEAQRWWLDYLSDFMKRHPEVVSYYHHELDSLSYIYTSDLQELVTKTGLEWLLKKEDLRASDELNQLSDENSRWFLNKIKSYPEGSEERKFFESMSDKDKLESIKRMNNTLNVVAWAFWAHFGQKDGVTKEDLEKNTNFKINWFKDNNWIHPRIALWFNVQEVAKSYFHGDGSKIWEITKEFKWLIPYIDVPIVNWTLTQDLNVDKIQNQNIHDLKALKQFYTRLWFNIWIHFLKRWENWITFNEDPTDWFTAGIETWFWVKKNYTETIEQKWQTLWTVLDKIFSGIKYNEFYSDKGILDKERMEWELKKKFKWDKIVEKYLKENQYEMERIVTEVTERLDSFTSPLPEFKTDDEKKNYFKNVGVAMRAMLRSVVENVKNEDKESLNGDTKLTWLWAFAWFWIWKHHWALTLWVEATISKFRLLYAPDSEKYQYMDESLKSWTDVFPFEADTSNKDAIEASVRKLLDRSTITGLNVKVSEDGLLSIEASDATMKKYFEKGEGSISDLFNIYVNPDQIANFKLEKNRITLWNVKDLSLVTRTYFDTFATYLFIGGKWVDGCKNNKVRFDDEHKDRYANDPRDKFHITWHIESETGNVDLSWGTEVFVLDKDTVKKVSKLDSAHSKKYSSFLKAMNEWNIQDATSQLETILQWSWIKLSLPNSEIWKINVLNAYKAAFAYDDRVHNSKEFKSVISRRKEVFARLNVKDLSQEEISEMVGLRGKLVDKDGLDISYNPENVNNNILWFTAFYARHAKWENVRWFSLTSLWATNIFWWAENYKLLNNEKIKEWVRKKIEIKKDKVEGRISQSPEWKQVYNQIAETLKKKLQSDFWITDLSFFENNKNNYVDKMLWPENYQIDDGFVNIWDWIKVKLNKEFVFYLLWECANESFWLKLGNIEIKRELWNQLSLWYWIDALTKVENIRENQASVKLSMANIKWKTEDSQTTEEESKPKDDAPVVSDGESKPKDDAPVIEDDSPEDLW